ncbi:MAG: ABC transporter ATP-binding protein [Gaiellaceae bacterium]
MAGLAYAGVRKDYGEITALAGLDLEVVDGELLALLGPSGSGKSTALRLAAGLEEVTSGTVRIGEREVTRLPPAKRNVSMVFQHYALFPHLTVAENIGFGLRARGMARQKVAQSIREASALTGCGALLERKPHELSGGERQRVALARALARRPDVYLLDEPLSNLDAQLRVDTRAELKRLHRAVGTTMVYVTHDQVEALTLGTRVAVIEAGALQQVGPPDEIYRQPANRFVARFVGSPSMNLLSASLRDGRLAAGPFSLEPPVGVDDLSGRRLEVGIRPEHVQLEPAAHDGNARVEVVEAAGSETLVYVTSSDATLVARVAPELDVEIGASVRLGASDRNVYVFDADTGVTLAGIRR